jgi:hypothetical protein
VIIVSDGDKLLSTAKKKRYRKQLSTATKKGDSSLDNIAIGSLST